MPSAHHSPMRAAMGAALLSILLVVMLAVAWMKSGSVSVLSAMVDSVMDIVISGSNVLVIKYAFRPADSDHRFGHGKMEGVAALVQAAFICGSGVFVLLEAIDRLSQPEAVTHHGLAIATLAVVTVLTLVLTLIQHRVAKESGSLAVEADRAHFVGDIAVNIGVIGTLVVDALFHVHWLDPLIAFVVVAWLVIMAFGIGRQAIDMLLDREVQGEVRQTIKDTIKQTAGVHDFHDLRVTRSGARLMVAVDLEVTGNPSLSVAHAVSRAVEDAVLAQYPTAHIMIHLDPEGDVHDSRHPV